MRPLRAGHCTACGRACWRTIAFDESAPVLLWPEPESAYGVYAAPHDHVIPGITFCASCHPALGSPAPEGLLAVAPDAGVLIRLDGAAARYAAWYTPAHRDFLEAWLRERQMPEDQQARVLRVWAEDRQRATVTSLVEESPHG